jgi:ABC-type proline/glycine betaine transport system permease subunit
MILNDAARVYAAGVICLIVGLPPTLYTLMFLAYKSIIEKRHDEKVVARAGFLCLILITYTSNMHTIALTYAAATVAMKMALINSQIETYKRSVVPLPAGLANKSS